jgi:exodeoxyribonuclease V alpha subunit
VRAFGDIVFDIIEQEPARLREVTGIGPKRAARIVGGWSSPPFSLAVKGASRL